MKSPESKATGNESKMSKPERRRVDVPIDYLGFEIPDVWVVGYDLDYSGLFRTTSIAALIVAYTLSPTAP